MDGRTFRRLVAAAALAAVLAPGAPAVADDGPGILVGYGIVRQERLGFESEGHLLSVGIHTPGEVLSDGVFASFTFDFVIDQTYHDLTALALTFEGAYAWGSESFGTYFGVCVRSGIDGYPDSSWAPFDPGGVLGLVAFLGPIGVGAEFRGWLGWNVYQDFSNEIEPYFDARLFLSMTIG